MTGKKERGKLLLAVLLAAGGVLLLLFGGKLSGVGQSRGQTEPTSPETAEEYRRELELTAASLCASVDGVETARVSVTLDGGIRLLYAQNGTAYVLSGGEALFLGYEFPSVTGCAVVYTGRTGDGTDLALTRLLSSYLALPASKISVCGAS